MMLRGSKRKLTYIYQELLQMYGPQGWWPVKGNYYPGDYTHPGNEQERLEIIVGAILTQNTAWKNVEKALSELHKKKLMSLEKLKKVPHKKLSKHIKSSGYFNQKAKKIKAIIEFLESGKEVTRENLLNVWGVGPETADSILLYAFKKPFFVIDAYTKRIVARLGISKKKDYNDLQDFFTQGLAKDVSLYNEYHALFVKLGKEICMKKPNCDRCPLRNMCSYSRNIN